MQINLIQSSVEVNSKHFLLYVGFMKAEDFPKFCRVPSFSPDKNHINIATNLANEELEEWQRPLLQYKVDEIIDLYSSMSDENIMPNAVLLGIDHNVISKNPYSAICEFTQPENSNVVQVTLDSKDGHKPLLILDGQHRIAGMSRSLQKSQDIPFVICGRGFTLPKLAEIFTHVTTKATQMKPLHKSWMQYNFSLGPFGQWYQRKAGLAAIRLCTESGTLEGNIKFNDDKKVNHTLKIGGFNQGDFTFSGWAKLINEFFYSQFDEEDAPDVLKLVNSINNMIDAIRETSSDLEKSKLFSIDSKFFKYHPLLCETLMQEYLSFLQKNTDYLEFTKDDWINYLKTPLREFHKVLWNLPYVLPGGQNQSDLSISRKVARQCFYAVFNDLTKLNSQRIHGFLKGDGGFFNLHAYATKANGKPDLDSIKTWKIKSDDTININEDGKSRNWVRISKGSTNWHLKKPKDGDFQDNVFISDLMVKEPKLDLNDKYPGLSEKKIEIEKQSYHSSSSKTIRFTVVW